MVLTGAHYIYIIFIVFIIATMIFKKEIVIPCILGVFALGIYYSGDIIGGLSSIFTAYNVALKELGLIIVIIGIMTSLSKTLEENKAIDFMTKPLMRVLRTPTSTFWIAGIIMLIVSWFFWPTPATALVGAIFIPIAKKSGLPIVALAMAMNLFGHGIGLSTDIIIQAAPAITAGAAGVSVVEVMREGTILYIVMSVVTVVTAFFMIKRDIKNGVMKIEIEEHVEVEIASIKTKISVLLVVVCFALNIIAMYTLKLTGSDATALLGGTGMLLLIIINTIENPKTALDKVGEHIVHGFVFGMRIFAVIIPIAGFFYMGDMAITQVYGDVLLNGSQGLLSDIGIALSEVVPFNKPIAAIIETVVGVITGLDGSGFSGMSLAGSIALVFDSAIGVNVGALSSLGQIAAIWVGGGCLVPWSLVVVAAICGVNPIEIAKKNFIPVTTGLVAATVVAMFII